MIKDISDKSVPFKLDTAKIVIQSSQFNNINLDLDIEVKNINIKKNKKPFLSLCGNLKLPFRIKLGIALSALSVGVATASIYWLELSIQKSLLANTAQELKKLGIERAANFSEQDIAAIEVLTNRVNSLSLPLSEQQIIDGKEKQLVDVPGLSPDASKKVESLKAYQDLARKLGEITNESRRDGSSDVYVNSSYLTTVIPKFPGREVVRIVATDLGYKYEKQPSRFQVNFLGYYYFPNSSSIRPAFDGTPQVDTRYYYYQSKNQTDAYISAAIPLKNDVGKVIAVLNLDVDVSSLAVEVDGLKWITLQIIGSSLTISLLAASVLSNWLVKPIYKLARASAEIRNRNFDIVVDISSNDEFQQLGEAFNAMVAEVSQYTNYLEDLVVERTDLLNQAKNELETDIEKGQKLQKDFLPNPILTVPNWEIVAAFQPAKKVAGDFYDVFKLPNGDIGLVIADVCDKGVGAAMFMGLFRSLIRLFSGATNFQLYDSAQMGLLQGKVSNVAIETELDLNLIQALKAVELTNNYISQEHGETGMFATMFFGILNPETGLLTYINGGHESPLIVNVDGIKAALKSTGPAVGMMPNSNFKIKQIQLEPGDILFGYTDGLTDARDPNREFFTEKRVLSLLTQPYSSATELLECMQINVFTHIDCAAQFDDITLLAVRRENSNTS